MKPIKVWCEKCSGRGWDGPDPCPKCKTLGYALVPPCLPAPARVLMRRLYVAVTSELDACGEDEVKQHPILRDKAKLLDKVKKYLETTKP